MPSSHSARLNLPYVAAGQLQKHVTVNEAFARLDALIQTAVRSRTTTAQPDDADEGDIYILPTGATGADWSGRSAGDLVKAESGGWLAIATPIGLLAVVEDAAELVVRLDDGWDTVVGLGGELQNLTRLGLNTTADAANPFAARVNKALWTAHEASDGGDGDLRMTLNKEGPGDVLSVLLQCGYEGRAELGLIGDDDLRLKVSPDGDVWTEAFRADPQTGRVWFAKGAARCETVLLSSGGDYAPPAWARTLSVMAVGGGGGGGTGDFADSGDRYGGAGGDGGGLSQAIWRTADLDETLSVAIGAGGAAGADGGNTVISSAGLPILTARGGRAGVDGAAYPDASDSSDPVFESGTQGGNRGGRPSIATAGGVGASLSSGAAPGGGGAGGGLDATGTARAGGSGGIGGVLTCPAPAGAGGSTGAGASGSAPGLAVSISGGGGGGGAAVLGAGAEGGAGGAYGAGGGGGGAGVSSGGLGGAGASGAVLILVQG